MNYRILSVVTFIIAVTPAIVFAQTPPPPFRVLVGIPGVDANTASIGQYINALYILSISIAALLAVIKIIIAGVKYVLSDVVTSKADAKSDIQGALIGLLIVISAVVILETINPQLRAMSLFLEPAAQSPGRPVRDTPTDSGQAPLPGVARGEGNVVTQFADEPSCLAARTACTSSTNGQIVQSGTNTSRVTCSYGTTTNLRCGQNRQTGAADCAAARAQCPAGSEYTQSGDFTARCFTPNPPNPRADDRGTRGGA